MPRRYFCRLFNYINGPMNLHEYQARAVLKGAGIPVPDGDVATTPAEAEAIARRVGGTVVIKAQVHSGGRGKAGGVKLAKTPAEAAEHASRILGMKIKGLVVSRVLVVPAADIASEAYVGLITDRETQRPVFMVSPAGGIDIEEVAAKTPEKIFRLAVDPRYGLLSHQALGLAFKLYDDFPKARAAAKIMEQLYGVFMANGASLVEINPLVTTPEGAVLALDAKISIDDNELERRPDLASLRDESAEEPAEVEARRAGLTFIKLDGNVGCVVNGAGLAMATMDLVKYYGGEPANFLDIGGSSNPGQGGQRAPDHHQRSGREGHPVQHFRRHHPHRRRGQRHQDRAGAVPGQGADRGAPHRHQRSHRGQDPPGDRHDRALRHG